MVKVSILIALGFGGCSRNENQFVNTSAYSVQRGHWLRLYDDIGTKGGCTIASEPGYWGSVNIGEPIR